MGGFEMAEVGRAASARESGQDAAYIHGADGMGNLSLRLPPPARRLAAARQSDEIIIEKLSTAPGEITVVAVGPLTNLATAEEKSPGILAKAKEVIVMGGAFRREGNVTSHSEFNVAFDPDAAQKVFDSREDLVVLPLDVTQQVTLTVEQAESVKEASPNSRVASFVVDLCQFMSKTSMGYRGTEGVQGFHVHDAATLAYLFYPETLLLRRAKVRVETQGEWTRGQTMFDDRHLARSEVNAWVAMEVDAVNLLAILLEDLKVLSESK
jgi:inosine-uridine nucleoside N-ribohydrolase